MYKPENEKIEVFIEMKLHSGETITIYAPDEWIGDTDEEILEAIHYNIKKKNWIRGEHVSRDYHVAINSRDIEQIWVGEGLE